MKKYIYPMCAMFIMAFTTSCSSFQAQYRVPWERKSTFTDTPIVVDSNDCLNQCYEPFTLQGENKPPQRINTKCIEGPTNIEAIPTPTHDQLQDNDQDPHIESPDKRKNRRRGNGYKEGEVGIAQL